MAQSATPPLRFAPPVPLPVAADFLGERLTSDAGLVWLEEADAALGRCAALVAAIRDWRRRRGRHGLGALVRQRVFQLACGYEDQADADALRGDPLLKLACGCLPEGDPDLASQPTFARLENAVDGRTCARLADVRFACYLRERATGGRRGSCSISTPPTTRPTAARRGPPTTASAASTCATHCWSPTATPTSWTWPPCAPATPTPARASSPCWACWRRICAN
jgi:hypothetical protein